MSEMELSLQSIKVLRCRLLSLDSITRLNKSFAHIIDLSTDNDIDTLFLHKTVQNKRQNICVSELLRYELSKRVANFLDGKYRSFS